jgi:uncharacterized protein YeaO (DUF488 family)
MGNLRNKPVSGTEYVRKFAPASMIRARRVYGGGEAEGSAFLVDRLWPRGVRKDDLRLDGWLRDAAPSDGLRRWFGHDPDLWDEFQRRYFEELDRNPDGWRPALEAAKKGDVTLLFGAKDVEHNNAVALKTYLERRLAR